MRANSTLIEGVSIERVVDAWLNAVRIPGFPNNTPERTIQRRMLSARRDYPELVYKIIEESTEGG